MPSASSYGGEASRRTRGHWPLITAGSRWISGAEWIAKYGACRIDALNNAAPKIEPEIQRPEIKKPTLILRGPSKQGKLFE